MPCLHSRGITASESPLFSLTAHCLCSVAWCFTGVLWRFSSREVWTVKWGVVCFFQLVLIRSELCVLGPPLVLRKHCKKRNKTAFSVKVVQVCLIGNSRTVFYIESVRAIKQHCGWSLRWDNWHIDIEFNTHSESCIYTVCVNLLRTYLDYMLSYFTSHYCNAKYANNI